MDILVRPCNLIISFILQFQWDAEAVTITPQQVEHLVYCRAREFDIQIDRNKAERKDAPGHEDPPLPKERDTIVEKQLYQRGQLVYCLPDPEWLEPNEDGIVVTIDDLRPEDLWLALVLDCVDIKHQEGRASSMLRVAVSGTSGNPVSERRELIMFIALPCRL